MATDYRIEALLSNGEWVEIVSSRDRVPFVSGGNDSLFAQVTGPGAATAKKLDQQIREIRARVIQLTQGESAWLGSFAQPSTTFRLHRGDPLQPREPVVPDGIAILTELGMSIDEPEQQRRVRLAGWIASRQNPLTARVMVNRIWHYLLGHGLVDTPSDFGKNGAAPTHPELLDWLASEFMDHGWSIKHIQRLILQSRTFQQSSTPVANGLAVDADARLLWRFPPRRLEAEAIRDSILATSSAMDRRIGGVGFHLQKVEEDNVYGYFPKENFDTGDFRRMVYLTRIRQEQDSVFGSFDCPSGNQVMPKRTRSNTPLQALNLFNSNFVLIQSEILADRLRHEAGADPASQVRRAFELLYGRDPDPEERELSVAVIRAQSLEAFARAMFNTSEFLFLF